MLGKLIDRYMSVYSGPPLIETPFLSNNSVLIRQVAFDEREHYMHSQYLLLVSILEGCSLSSVL